MKWYVNNMILAIMTVISLSVLYVVHTVPTPEEIGATVVSDNSSTPGLKVLSLPKLNAENIETLINQERVKAGLSPLAHSPALTTSACQKLNHIMEFEYRAHIAPDGTSPWFFIHNVGYDYSLAGENLAYDYRTDDATVAAWMNSETHRANILGDYVDSGVCVAVDSESQDTYVVQHFGTHK